MAFDLLDSFENLLDAVGVPKDGESKVQMVERKIDTFKKVAKTINIITDPELREEQFLSALHQAYRAGVENK